MRSLSRPRANVMVPVLVLILLCILTNCSDDRDPIILNPASAPSSSSAMTMPGTGCKTLDADPGDGSCFPYEDCLEYAYDGAGTLTFAHRNATFNCCLDSFAVTITRSDNLISICERQVLDAGGCDCECLYDLDYEVDGIEAGVYTVELVDPYRCHLPDRQRLRFTVDLTLTPSGVFCLPCYFHP